MADILANIRDFAPSSGPHPDRKTHRGYLVEAKVCLSATLRARNHDVSRFLIIARARSGTTLLTNLLDAHPDVTCDREVLAKKVAAPRSYLANLAKKSTTKAYGAKLLSYQMVLVQEFSDPVGFLKTLKQDGVALIHLRRDTFAQTVSLTRAQASSLYHSHTAKGSSSDRVDPEEFVRRLLWNAKLAEFEDRCLEDLEPLRLSYETDLAESTEQSTTANRVFSHIGVPSVDVTTSLKKILPSDPSKALENYDEIAEAVREAGLGHVLPTEN